MPFTYAPSEGRGGKRERGEEVRRGKREEARKIREEERNKREEGSNLVIGEEWKMRIGRMKRKIG